MNKKNLLVILYLLLVVGLLFVATFRGLWVDESAAARALETQGYSDVQITDYKWFVVGMRGCGGDAARFDATATNPAGNQVQLFVCVGWPFKGSTVRSE